MPNELVLSDKPKDECGVFAIYSPDTDVSALTYYGLYSLQHRGQESAGIAVSDGEKIQLYKNMGLVSEVFDEEILARYSGKMAIGHVRYSTTGESNILNAQPLLFHYLQGQLALVHNGNLTNANHWRNNLQTTGSVFQTTSDTEVFVNLIARYSQNPIEEALMKCMIDLKGAYALIVMTENKLVGVRDPFGIRPLCLGRLGKDGYILASESCALDVVGAEFIRDVEPGEIIVIDENGYKSIKVPTRSKGALCSFEYIYIARPDSIIDGKSVNLIRKRMGNILAKENNIEADLVCPVPDSGIVAAFGYAEGSGIPLAEGLMKNRYVGRTFIQPSQELRELSVRLKLNPIRPVIEGKDIILVDDSIVRGTTSRKLISLLKKAGAKKVHLVISSPPVLHPCYYGIDIVSREELIAAQNEVEEIRNHIGADSLKYLSLPGLLEALEEDKFCQACFNGKYPVEIPDCIGGIHS
ncbi:MAG: amidophosphoribosyltransferase [Desulfitibacter sp. BRH_c19]|nr:MAG: amidophosphoribosyltransferase [Desulfitibacter sp. BRH_c19]